MPSIMAKRHVAYIHLFVSAAQGNITMVKIFNWVYNQKLHYFAFFLM